MNRVNLQSGLKLGQKQLFDFRQFLIDSFQNYVGLRMASGGVVMKTDADTSFKITIDGAGNWTVAQGHIINDSKEIVENVIGGLSPASGLEPGDLTGDNPFDHTKGTTQYIVVQTKNYTQEVDFGSITVVAASNAVVGTDTQFTKWFEPGSKFNVANSGLGNNGDYIVHLVSDDTHITTESNFAADESGLKFSVLGTFFEGYPPGGNKNLHVYNSFSFRTTIAAPVLADGEYTLAKCEYKDIGAGLQWYATDQRSGNLFTLPGIRTAEIIDSMITLAKMANDSVDENKIISTTFGAGLEGGSGAKPTISNLGVTTAMLNNLAVTLGKMAVNSVDENKIISGIGDGTTIEGGSGSKLYIVGQPKFSATLSNGAVANIPDSINTTIIFNTLMYDIGTAYNVANGRFTPTIGYWHVDVQIMTDTLLLAVDKYIKLRFLRHNTLCFLFDKAFYGNGHTTNWHVGLSFDFYSDGTTYYEIQVLQNTGGATRLIGMPSNSYGNIFFNAHKIL